MKKINIEVDMCGQGRSPLTPSLVPTSIVGVRRCHSQQVVGRGFRGLSCKCNVSTRFIKWRKTWTKDAQGPCNCARRRTALHTGRYSEKALYIATALYCTIAEPVHVGCSRSSGVRNILGPRTGCASRFSYSTRPYPSAGHATVKDATSVPILHDSAEITCCDGYTPRDVVIYYSWILIHDHGPSFSQNCSREWTRPTGPRK